MSNLRLHLSDPQIAHRTPRRMPLGRHLVEAGIISDAQLMHALDLQRTLDAPLAEILVSERLISEGPPADAGGIIWRNVIPGTV